MAEVAADFPLHIRPLATIEEFRQVEYVQQRAWGTSNLADVVPPHVTLTAQKNGGLVAGAFDSQGTMLGFVFGFLGLDGSGKLKHCSHMMGVLPEARRHNVGYRLKLFQRHYVGKQGLDLITWTFDPLEGLNAMLNIGKLGGIARKYHYNLYGDWTDGLNKGLPTDRFEVEWLISSERVRQFVDQPEGRARPRATRATYPEAAPINAAQFVTVEGTRIPEPVNIDLNCEADTLLVEVPADFQAVKSISMDRARAWRQHTAVVFSTCFGRGYTAADFLSEVDSAGDRRNYFVLLRHVPDCEV